MAFIAPGILDFFTRYPEFRGFDQDWVQATLDEAGSLIGSGWIDRYRRSAIMALAAHFLITQQSGAPVSSEFGGGTTTGPIQSETVGPLTISYKRSTGRGGGGDTGGNFLLSDFSSTPYGNFYLQLVSMGIPAAILVV
jgi:hypothetical protein